MGAGADPPPAAAPARLAELAAALALATDLGTGQPLDHALRTCLLSLELARRSGVAADQLPTVYYLALLRFAGCTADAAESAAAVGGDDIAFIRGMAPGWMGSTVEQVRSIARLAGAGLPPLRRATLLAGMLADTKGAERSLTAHCEAAQLLATRLGARAEVIDALGSAFERWDGHGIPGRAAGPDVPAPVRVVIVARDADLWTRLAGAEEAAALVRRRSGRAYDPAVADAFADDPWAALKSSLTPDPWQATLEAEPTPWPRLAEDRFDQALGAFGNFTDLKSPWLRGHSSGVAALVFRAADAAGLDDTDRRTLWQAALVHDLGRVGVPNEVWDHDGPLTIDSWEQVRLHSYFTERILSRSRRLAPLARLAGCHHERVDGSGYHRGARAPELTRPERLLAAADAYHALTEQRPHRPARSPDDACAELRREAQEGRFEPADAEAVVEAAGHSPSPGGSRRPAGLTDREAEVLRLIARGRSNREVASALVISPKTVGTHVEHIYAKAGVSTRAGAALFAMQQGML